MPQQKGKRRNLFKEEARQFVRAKTSVEVEVIAGLTGVFDPFTLRGTCIEISIESAVILLTEPLQEGDEILVSFKMYSEVCECAAVVTGCRDSKKPYRHFVECQFQGISDTNYYYLSSFVFEQLRTRAIRFR